MEKETAKKVKGFSCFVGGEQVDAYRKRPLERRLRWLYLANRMRRSLPARTLRVQEAFRAGEI